MSDSCDPMDCSLPRSMGFSGKNTGVGCHFLLQGIFLTQESNLGLLHCRQILYRSSYEGNPFMPLAFLQSETSQASTPALLSFLSLYLDSSHVSPPGVGTPNSGVNGIGPFPPDQLLFTSSQAPGFPIQLLGMYITSLSFHLLPHSSGKPLPLPRLFLLPNFISLSPLTGADTYIMLILCQVLC